MKIGNQGLAFQGSGSGESNYGVRFISSTKQFSYASGMNTILTLSVASNTPTNFMLNAKVNYFGDDIGTSNSGGPANGTWFQAWLLNSSGYFVEQNWNWWWMEGNGWTNMDINYGTLRTILFRASGSSSSHTSLLVTYSLQISCSDFSYVTFS